MNASPDPLRLAEILAARLCHDLASPVGVLSGLLDLAQGGDASAVADAQAAASALADRLRLLRAAWAADPAPLMPAALLSLAAPLACGGRVVLDAAGLSLDGPFSPAAGRVALNLLLLGAQSLHGQGSLHLAGSSSLEISLRIAGPRAAWPPGTAACLGDPDTAWSRLEDVRGMQLPLTVLLAQQAGLRLGMLMPMSAPASAPPPLLLQLA
jgi:histidine phosphotransferase ChpT